MTRKKEHTEKNTAYFETFTTVNWLNLIQEGNAYDSFYKWFDYLNERQIYMLAYVVMPNHFHGIIYLNEEIKTSINKIVGNGKRFIAYEIVKQLQEFAKNDLLKQLEDARSISEIKRRKLHKVFKTSFDCIEITNRKQLEQTMDYIHKNPCNKNWNLAKDYVDYVHSSAAFYEREKEIKWIRDYREFY